MVSPELTYQKLMEWCDFTYESIIFQQADHMGAILPSGMNVIVLLYTEAIGPLDMARCLQPWLL
jgi:hypothetical protein